MRTYALLLLLAFFFFSCRQGKNVPDVGHIKVPLQLERFDKDLFAMDTNNMRTALPALATKYPNFAPLFVNKIINADPAWPKDTTDAYVKSFVSAYRNIYDTAQIVFSDFGKYEKELQQMLKHVKYYFPKYHLPSKLIAYIGPIDGYGDLITQDALAIALHQHLGSDYSMYNNGYILETYPQYVTQRFVPQTISVNAAQNIVDDMYRKDYGDKTLLVQMVENGKRLYLKEQFLPEKEDNWLIGYTRVQIDQCYKNERFIWDMFLKGNYLQSTDVNAIKNFVAEGPKTQELGEDAPGNIGSFIGWQIVRNYMDRKPKTSLKDLMALDAEKLFEEAKYKP